MERRKFLQTGGLATAAAVLPASTLFGQNAPGNQVTFGFIGVGGMGGANIDRVLGLRGKGAKILAVCDVDRFHQKNAADKVNKSQGNNDCAMVGDFRKLTRRKDIDAIVVSTPDHWHALPAIDAIRNGKDVYVEKPLTLTVREGQVLVSELRKHKRVGQTGTQQRSDKNFRFVAEFIRNGGLGKIKHIDVLIPANNMYVGSTYEEQPVPDGLDYDMWLGPAPWAPFNKQRTHYQFRYNMDYAGGQTTNWGAHYLDIAQWALGMDESGPTEVEGFGEFPQSGLFTAPTRVDFTVRYAGGPSMHVGTRSDGVYDGNIIFHGEKGSLNVSRSKLVASDPAMLKTKFGEGDVRLYKSDNHMGNFLDCIRSREKCVSDLAIGHRTTTICNIGNIAMQLKRKLVWDPAKEVFQDDVQANRLLQRPMRAPWSLV
jgi:predicted dehydrogenase